MMRRMVVILIAMSCTCAMLAPVACGKYASPQRVSRQPMPQPPAASPSAVEQDRDDEPPKQDKR